MIQPYPLWSHVMKPGCKQVEPDLNVTNYIRSLYRRPSICISIAIPSLNTSYRYIRTRQNPIFRT